MRSLRPSATPCCWWPSSSSCSCKTGFGAHPAGGRAGGDHRHLRRHVGDGDGLNTLSLFGLVLAIGIVVDDAIVVVEATEHHIEEGMSPGLPPTRPWPRSPAR